MKEGGPVILFDGVCNYCNSMVNFAIRNDRKALLKFAPLQENAGKKLLEPYPALHTADSVVLIENGKAYTLSTAALRIAGHLDWPAKILAAFLIIPAFIRDPIYKWVSRNRYKWFGKKNSCMVPAPGVRDRFLH